MLLRSCLVALASAALLLAQGGPSPDPSESQPGKSVVTPANKATGWRMVRFPKAGGRSGKLPALVCYPSRPGQTYERDAELARRRGGYPVIVFLHGFGSSGDRMLGIGRHFARHGYIVVLTNTTRFDRDLQARNARAFFTALDRVNQDDDSFLHGQLDTLRVGIGGHSMGGGNAMRVLADNPGYLAGFCFAPWTTHPRGKVEQHYVKLYADQVRVPLGILHGINDHRLPWRDNAMRLFEAMRKDRTLKALWLLDQTASHANIAHPSKLLANRRVFEHCLRTATAFFDRYLRDRSKALDRFLDPKRQPKGVLRLHLHRGAAPQRAARPERAKTPSVTS